MRRGLRLLLVTSVALSLLLAFLRQPALSLLISAGNSAALQAASSYLGAMCLLYILSFWANGYQGGTSGAWGGSAPPFAAPCSRSHSGWCSPTCSPASWGLLSVALATGLGWVVMIAFQTCLSRRLTALVMALRSA